LRLTGLGIVISYGAAFFALNWQIPDSVLPFAATWIGGVILTPAAVCSGIAFGKFVQITLLQHPRSSWAVLCSIGCGSLFAPQAKFIMNLFGPTLAFVLILLGFVAILTILPVNSSEDEQPEAW
jgi:hypothetical protein